MNSHLQLKRLVYGEWNLPLAFLNGKVSTSHKALVQLLPDFRIEALIQRQKLIGQLKQCDTILRFSDPDTNAIHPYINTLGADTGRCTSSNPNLQNIEKKSSLRKLFKSRPGHKLIVFDFSQIEPRALAHFVGEGAFRELFSSDQDFYTRLATEVFSNESTNAPVRDIAKQVVLGVMYGLGAKRMATNLGVSLAEAQGFISKFFKRYPEIELFKKRTIKTTCLTGFAEGLMGRRRYIDAISSEDEYERYQAERQAINAVIQGSATTLFKYKLVQIRRALPLSVKFLLHVHDEVILEAPEEQAERLFVQIKRVLEDPVSWFAIPLQVDGGIGSTWTEAKKSENRKEEPNGNN
ncbi:MAG: hypothetical protein H7301_04930 [Cryobacterium sp.]|nr:hypothetical protein [Oligoflexia bacterium]